MLSDLKFVQGAVAKKDFVPALTHFRIANGSIKGFNGSLAICSPINLDIDAAPRAADFVKAIAACDQTIALSMSPNGKLVVRSGDFKAHINCDDPKNFPDIAPTGQFVKLSNSLLPALACLEPFIAEDASRPWACGILFDGESAFATNNIVVVQHWLGFNFPGRVNIPGSAVKELLRIGKNPVRLQIEENRLTFHYEDGKWISSQLFEAQWPPTVELLDRFLNVEVQPAAPELFDALERLIPFTDPILARCYFHSDHIATTPSSDVDGISLAVACPAAGIFNAKQLFNLKPIAEHIGFASYPSPVPFFGAKTRGVILGCLS